jgi:hypothetical protein
MEVGGCEEQLPVARREFRRYARDGCAVPRAETGIHHQRRIAADDDRDVGPAHDRPDVVRYFHGVFAEHGLGLRGEGGGSERAE